MEMKAALLYAPHDIRVETREVAPCGDHDIIINLKKACLCPTDIKKYNADKPDVEGALKEYGPCILGHEAAGVVVEAGARVTAVKKGDRVAVQPMIFCGECGYCKEGRTNLCPHVIGVGCSAGGFGECEKLFYEQGIGGCFATHLKTPEICAMKLPDSLSMEAGSLLEPLADVVHSVDHALTGPGDDVAVLGLGPMGLLHVAAARYNGARHVIAVDLDESRLDIARRLGADQIVNSRQGDPVAQVKALTGGVGANKVFVVPGGPAQAVLTVQAMDMAAKGGTVSLFSSSPTGADAFTVSINRIHYSMINFTGTVGFGNAHAEKAIEMLASGAFDYTLIRNREMPLSQINEAIALYGRGKNLKIGLDLEA